MTDTSDLLSTLDALAKALVEDAKKPEVKLTDKIDLFKILSQHYAIVAKVNGKAPPPSEGGTTMSDLRNRIAGDEQGTGDSE